MLRWFRALLPKEERFFELFARHSRTVVASAEALRIMLEGGESISRHSQEIMAREHEGDNIARKVLLAVRRTFITPFDRRDIVNLISSMDDAIDQMQNTAKVITLFEVRTFDAIIPRPRRERRPRRRWELWRYCSTRREPSASTSMFHYG